jgi:hypothetical protein
MDILTLEEIGKKPVFVWYEKRTPDSNGTRIETLRGLATDKNRVIHRNVGLNQFLREETTIPKGYNKKRKIPDKAWFKKYFYDPLRKPIVKKTVPELRNKWKNYKIHDNGGRPFVVYVSPNQKEVSVYTVPKEQYVPEDLEDIEFPENLKLYTKRLLHVKPNRVFVGKSPKNSMTLFSGGYGSRFYGNTVLLEMKNNSYIYISRDIEYFQTKSPIVRYVSPVGNNDVPYPFAVTEDRTYYLLGFGVFINNVPERQYLKPSDCSCDKDMKERVSQEPYGYYHQLPNGSPDVKKIKITKRIKSETY